MDCWGKFSERRASILAVLRRREKVKYVLLVFLLISCLGFLIESVYCFGIGLGFHDRGFLILPICPIYGVSVCLMYFLFSVPDRVCFLNRPLFEAPTSHQKLKKYCMYFVFAALLPTVAELVTGFILDALFDLHLWHYFDYPLNFHGYVCLEISVSWGILITVFMKFVFDRILRFVTKVPPKTAAVISIVFGVLITIDFLFNLIYIIVTGNNLILY